jgi:hypothetical protein
MINGNSANFERRLTKLEDSKLGVPANLAGFRPPTIIVHDGEDEDKIIKETEARGEIPPVENFPAGRIRVLVHRIISPPNGEPNWERYHTERHRARVRSPLWVKVKNPNAPAVKREAEEDWER